MLSAGCGYGAGSSAHGASTASARLSLLAVGDTGCEPDPWPFDGQRAVAAAMDGEAERAPVDGIVLLGDNFYWHGLEHDRLVERIRVNLVRPYCRFLRLGGPRSDAVRDACPVPEAARRPVPIHAVLGNHDLDRPESAELEREAIPEFLPDWNMGSGLAEAFELGRGVSLILFESEVAIDDEPAIRRALVRAIRSAQGPWRILAAHRPVATDDLGGVPIGGYPMFVRDAIAAAGKPVQLVLAGHHHNLQAFELERPTPMLQIDLGSGCHARPPLAEPDHPAARFGAIQLGFGRVDLLGTGEDERLVVTIHGGSRWAWLTSLRGTRIRARFAVDRAGRVERMPIPNAR